MKTPKTKARKPDRFTRWLMKLGSQDPMVMVTPNDETSWMRYAFQAGYSAGRRAQRKKGRKL